MHANIDVNPNDWSRDGKYILYTAGNDLWYLMPQDLKTSLFLKALSVIRNGQFSPDGKWVAYASNETGKWEIYVASFPDARLKRQISTSGGEQPRWRRDGKELFYISSDEKIMGGRYERSDFRSRRADRPFPSYSSPSGYEFRPIRL